MKRFLAGIAALAAIAMLTIGVTAAMSAPRAAAVASASSPLGRILVDGRGHTLYLFEKDTHGRSACSGQCARFWHPLVSTGKPRATSGAKASLLGTVRRADGRLQATYNHHPLYTFVQDVKKGQTTGEGLDEFGAEWYVLSPAGTKVERSEAQSPSGSGAGSSTTPTTPAYGGYSIR